MKANFLFVALVGAVLFSCGESEEDRLAREKTIQDSIVRVKSLQEQKTMEDSLVNLAKDSIITADSSGATVDGVFDSTQAEGKK